MRDQVAVQRCGNPRHLRKLVEGQRIAVRVARPGPCLDERLIVRRQPARDGRSLLQLEIADHAVAIQVEIHQWRAADVLAGADHGLGEPAGQRARRHGFLVFGAGLEAEGADGVFEAERPLQYLLLDRHVVGVGTGILEQAVDVVATAPLGVARQGQRPADAERAFRTPVAAFDDLREPFRLHEISASERPP